MCIFAAHTLFEECQWQHNHKGAWNYILPTDLVTGNSFIFGNLLRCIFFNRKTLRVLVPLFNFNLVDVIESSNKLHTFFGLSEDSVISRLFFVDAYHKSILSLLIAKAGSFLRRSKKLYILWRILITLTKFPTCLLKYDSLIYGSS